MIFDPSKGFDTVNHDILFHKSELIGIRNKKNYDWTLY